MKRIYFYFFGILLISACEDDDKYFQTFENTRDASVPAVTSYDGSLKVSLNDENNIPITKLDLRIHLEYSKALSTTTTHYYKVQGTGLYSCNSSVNGDAIISEGIFSVRKSDPERFIALTFSGGKLANQTLRLNLSEIDGNEISGKWFNVLDSEGGTLFGNTDCQRGLLSLPK